QDSNSRWVFERINGNLKGYARLDNQLVTKHIVKGRCQYFSEYLAEHAEAEAFFRPLMGAYGPTHLNREAYLKDLMKYSSSIVVGKVDTDLFEIAVQNVITIMEEIGFTQCEYITDAPTVVSSLNLNAAMGARFKGKKRLFFEDMSDEQCEFYVQHSCKRLFTGQMGIWNGSLKAELRPKEKLEQNKTRTFTAAPIDTLLGGKVCVDDFNNKFYALHIKGPWTVGMTKFYKQWDRLLNELPDGWVYSDADGSQFDSSLTPYLINAVLNIRLHFMEEWDLGAQMLSNLYTEIIYTPIATPDGTIVKKHKGNNSGQPSTVVDNSLMVCLAMQYSLLKNGIILDAQRDIIRYFVNGDDLLVAVNPDFEYLYDKFSDNFQELGLNYTFSATTHKSDLWFMSHVGIKRDGIWIPKLEPERIVSILEWDRSTQIEHRLEAICASMIEAWGYDDLLKQIRLFYRWLLNHENIQECYLTGHIPYVAESALRRLYMDEEVNQNVYDSMIRMILDDFDYEDERDAIEHVYHQA
nr:Nib [Cucurbit vein banding virus]